MEYFIHRKKYAPLLITLLLLVQACTTGNDSPNSLFASLADDEYVFISLQEYQLQEIPEEIGNLRNAKTLIISETNSTWAILRPPDANAQGIDNLPFRILPESIGRLNQLQNLSLDNLDLKKLPESLGDLENLKTLNLAYNKLKIADEVAILSNLKNLNKLIVVGNSIDEESILLLQKTNPNLVIVAEIEPVLNP